MVARRGPAPISDAIVNVVASMLDDAGATRAPSHWDLEQRFKQADLLAADPHADPANAKVGKRKRVHAVLSWALDNAESQGEKLVGLLLALIRSVGGFRPASENFIGLEAIRNAQEVFRSEGFTLSEDGELLQQLLDNLEGSVLTKALSRYVQRARKGANDAALVTGTGKDLMEATAAHIVDLRTGGYTGREHFPELLMKAYTCLGLCIDSGSAQSPQDRVDAGLFQTALAVNNLRNREGTGHGRPFLSGVTVSQSRIAIGAMGLVAERLLVMLKENR
jgi:hypothetical protein